MGLPSAAMLWFAEKQPTLLRPLLWLWLKGHILLSSGKKRDAHWLLLALANLSRYRLPVKGRLRNGMSIWVPWNDHIGQIIYADGYYEPDLVAVIERILKPGMVFFDVGAHIGQYTLVASQVVGQTGQLHSFEPDPETYGFLEASVALNNLDNVHLNRAALSSQAGVGQLYLASVSRLGDNSLAPPKGYSGVSCEVRCLTLDEYITAKRLSRVDVMKVDIEGAELAMLQGGRQLFSLSTRPVVIMEFEEARQQAFGSSCRELAVFFIQNGYQLFAVERGHLREYSPGPDDPVSLNVLAVPKERRDCTLALLGCENGKL